MNFHAILFDLDGTMTDPSLGIVNSILYALERMGVTEPDPAGLVSFIGPPLRQSFACRYGFKPAEVERAVALFREYFTEQGIFENRLHEGVERLLKNLVDGGADLVLATSKPTVFARRILNHFALAEYFVAVQGSELDGRRTCKQDVVRDALGRVTSRPAVMVGDRGEDVRGARANGIAVAGVKWGFARANELETAAPDYLVHTMAQLQGLLGD